jgi:hypothetical protein
LNALFTKGAGEIEQKRQEWSHYTAEPCVDREEEEEPGHRDANYKMANGGAPENDHQQMSSEGGKIGGPALIEKKKKSPARDANYKMANGGAAANDHQQMSSDGGRIGGQTKSNNNQQRLKGEDQGVYEVGYFEERSSQHIRDLGLGMGLDQQKAFEMEVATAIKKVPGRPTKNRKRRVAELMVPEIPFDSNSYRRGKFYTAWKKHKHKHL